MKIKLVKYNNSIPANGRLPIGMSCYSSYNSNVYILRYFKRFVCFMFELIIFQFSLLLINERRIDFFEHGLFVMKIAEIICQSADYILEVL